MIVGLFNQGEIKETVLAKVLIAAGILLMVGSLFGVIAGIISGIAAFHGNETAGIGALGGGLQFALISIIAFFVGLTLIVAGIVRLYRDKKSEG